MNSPAHAARGEGDNTGEHRRPRPPPPPPPSSRQQRPQSVSQVPASQQGLARPRPQPAKPADLGRIGRTVSTDSAVTTGAQPTHSSSPVRVNSRSGFSGGSPSCSTAQASSSPARGSPFSRLSSMFQAKPSYSPKRPPRTLSEGANGAIDQLTASLPSSNGHPSSTGLLIDLEKIDKAI